MVQLHQLAEGASARLLGLGGGRGFRRRLLELGLLPGTDVRLVRRVASSGLIELEVRGCHLSLRHAEAMHLQFHSVR